VVDRPMRQLDRVLGEMAHPLPDGFRGGADEPVAVVVEGQDAGSHAAVHRLAGGAVELWLEEEGTRALARRREGRTLDRSTESRPAAVSSSGTSTGGSLRGGQFAVTQPDRAGQPGKRLTRGEAQALRVETCGQPPDAGGSAAATQGLLRRRGDVLGVHRKAVRGAAVGAHPHPNRRHQPDARLGWPSC
jgi:hypothetical protein